MYYNPTNGFVTPGFGEVTDDGYYTAEPINGPAPHINPPSPAQPTPTAASPIIERQAPPSSYAVAAVLDGEEGSVSRLIGLTVLRATFIFPGLWVGGKIVSTEMKLWQTAVLSLTTSVGITSGMLLWYKIQKDWTKRHDVAAHQPSSHNTPYYG